MPINTFGARLLSDVKGHGFDSRFNLLEPLYVGSPFDSQIDIIKLVFCCGFSGKAF